MLNDFAFVSFFKQSISPSVNNKAKSLNKPVFRDFQHRMLNWMSENYGRMVDLFRRFDSDNSGQLSYEEFADGMRELGKKD